MVKNRIIPRYVQKTQHFLHPLFRMQNQLFVGHSETLLWPQFPTLIVHRFYCTVPLFQTLPVTSQVETGYSHFSGYDRVHCGSAIANHEDELRVREKFYHVSAHFYGQGILVAESRCGFAVFRDYLECECRDGGIQDRFADSGLLQP